MFRKITAAALALIMLLSCASCSKEETTLETDESGNIITADETATDNGKQKVLTEVFSSDAIVFPDGYSMVHNFLPYLNKDNGEITFVLEKSVEETDEETGEISYKTLYNIVVYDKELKLVSEKELSVPLSSDESYITNISLVKDKIYFIELTFDRTANQQSYTIIKYDITSEETVYSQELSGLFEHAEEMGFLNINNFFVDDEESIYIASMNELLVLNSDFVKQYSISVPNWINSASMSPDGDIYIASYFDTGSGIAKLNKQAKDLDEPIIPEERINDMYFGADYDFYAKNNSGLCGYTVNEDGSITPTTVMNFSNSNIMYGSLNISLIIDKEHFIAEYHNSGNSGTLLFSKADDIDLSQITTIEIAALTNATSSLVSEKIINYNSANKDKRVVVVDYTKYNSKENQDRGGYEKLMNDIMNGIYKPDIILISNYGDYENGIVENELYTDLYPYIDASEGKSRDDFFGCIHRQFSVDGKMWGIAPMFYVSTLAGKTSTLGDRTSWNCDEFIDFALSLPDDKVLAPYMAQYNVFNIPGFFERFIDFENNTCNFESEEFYKTLEFVANLPAEYDSKKYRNEDNRYQAYQDDTIALYSINLQTPSDILYTKAIFNNEDSTLIGYPTNGENARGSEITYEYAYILTSCSENKDAAWDYLSSVIYNDGRIYSHSGFSALRDKFDKQCESEYDMENIFYFDGSGLGRTYDPENPTTESDLRSPGVITRFTEKEKEMLIKFFDEECGSSISEVIPTEVKDMINEELSSFTSGAKSAEECAKVIQSRVSIYLAEHE